MTMVCVVMTTVIGGEMWDPMAVGDGDGGQRWKRCSCHDLNRSLHTLPWTPENLCQIVHSISSHGHFTGHTHKNSSLDVITKIVHWK